MQGFPPANKYGQQITMKLASLYGLKSSVQGSGKQRFVVVSNLPALVRWWPWQFQAAAALLCTLVACHAATLGNVQRQGTADLNVPCASRTAALWVRLRREIMCTAEQMLPAGARLGACSDIA